MTLLFGLVTRLIGDVGKQIIPAETGRDYLFGYYGKNSEWVIG
jgi:hypothetical protein